MDIGHVLIVIFKHVLAVWNTVWGFDILRVDNSYCIIRKFETFLINGWIFLHAVKIQMIGECCHLVRTQLAVKEAGHLPGDHAPFLFQIYTLVSSDF
jgi:hypothetical protein